MQMCLCYCLVGGSCCVRVIGAVWTYPQWKCTHQFEVLNATNEVGSVGSSTFNVHTICKLENTREKIRHTLSLREEEVDNFPSFHVVQLQPDSVTQLLCELFPPLKRHLSPPVKFNWNASNRIKDFWNTTRLPSPKQTLHPRGIMLLFHPLLLYTSEQYSL